DLSAGRGRTRWRPGAWRPGQARPARPEEEERAKAILASHRDRDWSLCDAISFAVLDSRGARTAFTFDRHFRQYGRFQVIGPEEDGPWRRPAR
ncbi:MAG TPA: hypothetical protein VGD07_01750, partial [Methylomirabilota bacterium]